MTKATYYGFVKGGKLELAKRVKERMAAEMTSFPDCNVVIEIKKQGKRSLLQNAYYWGVIVPEIAQRLKELGNDVDHDVVHEYLKGRFNATRVVVEETGEAIDIPNSTTKLNKGEMVEYIDRIIEWAAQSLSISIPPPSTQTELFMAA